MGIGASLFLIAAGAILAFGVSPDSVGWVNVDIIGWILMAVGALGLVLTAFFWGRRRQVVQQPPVINETPVVREPPVRERPV